MSATEQLHQQIHARLDVGKRVQLRNAAGEVVEVFRAVRCSPPIYICEDEHGGICLVELTESTNGKA